jgi:hypothetical protein
MVFMELWHRNWQVESSFSSYRCCRVKAGRWKGEYLRNAYMTATFLIYLLHRLRAVRRMYIELVRAASGRRGYVWAAPPPSNDGEVFADPLVLIQAGDMHPLVFRLSNATLLFPFI